METAVYLTYAQKQRLQVLAFREADKKMRAADRAEEKRLKLANERKQFIDLADRLY